MKRAFTAFQEIKLGLEKLAENGLVQRERIHCTYMQRVRDYYYGVSKTDFQRHTVAHS